MKWNLRPFCHVIQQQALTKRFLVINSFKNMPYYAIFNMGQYESKFINKSSSQFNDKSNFEFNKLSGQDQFSESSLGLLDNLFLESGGSFSRKKLGIHRQSSGHREAPAIADLADVVEINFGNQESFFSSGKSWSSGRVRSSNIAKDTVSARLRRVKKYLDP